VQGRGVSVLQLWACSVGAQQAGFAQPSSSTSWQARQIFLYPHATSSSHLKWEARGGGNTAFSSWAEFIPTACRPAAEARRR
jgi:hypothetical protein